MKITDHNALNEAKVLELHCELVQVLGGAVLRIERTEEEIARGNYYELRAFAKSSGIEVDA